MQYNELLELAQNRDVWQKLVVKWSDLQRPTSQRETANKGIPPRSKIIYEPINYLSVVKLLSKRWWIPIGARQGLKLEPEGPGAGVGFPTADQGFSSIQGTVWLSKHLSTPSMDECK